jgi:hypothetical protein
MTTIYGSRLHDSHVYSSGIHGSSYLSRKHLKRAIKYGSYYGGIAAAPEALSFEATASSAVHAPLYASRYHTKGGYQSSHTTYGNNGTYLGAPVLSSTHAAPVATATVASSIYRSGSYSRQAAYFAHKASKYGHAHGSIYGSHVLPTAAATSCEDATYASSAPVIYGSSYLSRKHLKRAIKYGSHYSGYY